jgi:hypothetical protein
MKTEALIKAIAQDAQIEQPIIGGLLVRLVLAVGLAFLAVWLTLGFRSDFLLSLVTPLAALRYVLAAALGLIGLRLAFLLARPEGRDLARFWPLAAVLAVALGLLAWAYLATPADGRQMALVGKTMTTCLIAIPVLSILPVTAILMSLRKGATTAPKLAGFVAGVAGGGFAATVYATHCIEDSPLFYVTWYGIAICIVAGVSTLVGARALRW